MDADFVQSYLRLSKEERDMVARLHKTGFIDEYCSLSSSEIEMLEAADKISDTVVNSKILQDLKNKIGNDNFLHVVGAINEIFTVLKNNNVDFVFNKEKPGLRLVRSTDEESDS